MHTEMKMQYFFRFVITYEFFQLDSNPLKTIFLVSPKWLFQMGQTQNIGCRKHADLCSRFLNTSDLSHLKYLIVFDGYDFPTQHVPSHVNTFYSPTHSLR